MASLGVLSVTLTANTKNFQRNIKGAKREVSGLRGVLGVTARQVGFLAGSFLGFRGISGIIGSITEQFAEIDKLGKRASLFGLTIKGLRTLQEAAKLTGVSVEAMETGFQRLTRRVAEAGIGMGEARLALFELGLSAKRLSELKPDDLFGRIADAINEVENPGKRLRIAFKLLDTEGVRLVETMRLGSKGLQELGNSLEERGVIPSEELVNKITRANDAITEMKTNASRLAQAVAGVLAPAFEKAAAGLEKLERLTQEFLLRDTPTAKGFQINVLKKIAAISGGGGDRPTNLSALISGSRDVSLNDIIRRLEIQGTGGSPGTSAIDRQNTLIKAQLRVAEQMLETIRANPGGLQ